METVSPLPSEFAAVGEHLTSIYESLPDTTLAEEEGRLRVRFLDIGSRLLAISKIRTTA